MLTVRKGGGMPSGTATLRGDSHDFGFRAGKNVSKKRGRRHRLAPDIQQVDFERRENERMVGHQGIEDLRLERQYCWFYIRPPPDLLVATEGAYTGRQTCLMMDYDYAFPD